MSDLLKEENFKSYKICVANEMLKQKKEVEESSDTSTDCSSSSSSSSDSEEGELSEDSEQDVELNVIVGAKASVDTNTVSKSKGLQLPEIGRLNKKFSRKDSAPCKFDDELIDFVDVFEQCIKEDSVSEVSDPNFKRDVLLLFKSLDLTQHDFLRGGWRPEAICIKGIDELSSKDIFNYFKDYSPESIEWINRNTCNVLWPDKVGPIKALIGLSCPIQPAPKVFNKTKLRHKDEILVRNERLRASELRFRNSSSISTNVLEKKRQVSIDTSSDSSSSGSVSDNTNDASSDSDSNSGSSSDSSSNSGSSDSSDSESENNSKKNNDKMEKISEPVEDTVALPPNFHPIRLVENNSIVTKGSRMSGGDDSNLMEVGKEELHVQSQAFMTWDEIGVPILSGHWRLGVPCANASAILMRFAHCKEKKDPIMMEKPLDTYNEVFGKNVMHISDRDYQFGSASLTKLHGRDKFRPNGNKFTPPEYQLFTILGQNRDGVRRYKESRDDMDHIKQPLGDRIRMGPGGRPPPQDLNRPPIGQRSYMDLDNPFDDTKNPWGFLAENWSHKATQESLDYKSLLIEHITGEKKRKRPVESDLDSDGTEQSRRNDIHRSSKKIRRSRNEESDESGTDNSMEWRSKIRLPRMRMYADSEEKKSRKVMKRNHVRDRIGFDDEWRERGVADIERRNERMFSPPSHNIGNPPQKRRAMKLKRTYDVSGRDGGSSNIRSRIMDMRS